MPNYNLYPVRGMPTISTMLATEVPIATASKSEEALAANNSRLYALFVNHSDKVMFLRLGETAVEHEGIPLAVGGHYEITWTNLYQGVVNVICEAAGTDKILLITEGT